MIAVVGALLKFVLNEGLARWQLSTGTTLLEGWARYLGRWVQYLFLAYLIVWSCLIVHLLAHAAGILIGYWKMDDRTPMEKQIDRLANG